MKNLFKRSLSVLLAASILAGALTACGSEKAADTASTAAASPSADTAAATAASPSADTAATSSGEVKKLTIAFVDGSVPYAYSDDKGNPTGNDIELLRLVDEELPDYEFEYIFTSYDDIYVGLSAGSYDGGDTNSFYTVLRDEKYLIPDENIGGSLAGITLRKENSDVTTLEEAAKQGLTINPMKAGNGMTYQVEKYNELNPSNQIKLEYTDETGSATVQKFEWLVNKKYDFFLDLKTSYEKNVVAEDGTAHQYADQIVFNQFKTIKTYILFSRVTLDEKFIEEYDAALKKLKDNGKASEVAKEFYGEDIYSYTYDEGK